ncbi:MAG: TonB-dependent receptor [Acidobacteria bacterium]|nr:TonB-dependent receptor [Acidobacteriota bacterium]
MNLKKFLVCSLMVVLSLACAPSLVAQGTDLGTLRGLVTDATGAAIPRAKVVILDLATNTSRETTTNSQGEYQMFGLRAGNYKVTVSAAGMGTTDVTGIVLNGSATVSANATLKVASNVDTIEVVAVGSTINTENQTISDTITNRAVVDLPRDSRDVYSFLYLNPNITQAGSSDNVDFKFLGGQSYGANFSVDGQRSNGGIFGAPTNSQPSIEAVGEINVLTNDFSAEYGGIANIRVNTKRGSAGYHGSIFYNNSNSALAAWTLADIAAKGEFAPTPFQSKYPNPYFNLTDVGGSLGGPIPGLKKTWFFTAYERNWEISPVRVSATNLPHPSLYTGDFSLVDDANKPAVPGDVTLTPEEMANDTVGGLGQKFITIPTRLLNPTVQSLIGTYFPKIGLSAPINLVTGAINGPDDLTGYQTQLSGRLVRDRGTLRVDHDFSDRDHVNAVYNALALTSARPLVQNPYTGLGLQQLESRNNTLSFSYTHAFSANVINEARGGFNKERLQRHSNTTLEGFLSGIGFDQSDIDAYGAVVGTSKLTTHGHPAVQFGRNFAIFQNGGRNTDRPMDQNLATFGDTLTWVVRKHTLKMGADFVRNQALDGFAVNRGNVRGLVSYGSARSIDPFAKFLLGEPANTVSYVNFPRPPMDVSNWEQGFFVQDDWKVTPRLTVNMGLRYELITPFVESHDLLANFDPNFVDSNTGTKGRFVIPSDRTRAFLDPRILGQFNVVNASQAGLNIGRGLVRTDKNNFAPRIGAAFRLTDKSVIRGGYGLFYPTSAAQGIRDPIGTNPFNQGLTKASDPDAGNFLSPWPGFEHGFSPLTGGSLTTNFASLPSINAVPVGLEQPRIQQYNVTYERELTSNSFIRFSYLGSALSGLIAGKDLNEIQPSDIPFGTTIGDGITPCDPVNEGDCLPSAADIARQPFPGLGDFLSSFGNVGHGRSNAFQTQFEHRYSHGLLLNMSYTYLQQKSTALDTVNSSLGGVGYNPFEPDRDYGQESFVPHHRFVAYAVYDLPVGRGKRFGSSMSNLANTILGGWQTSFNMFAKSGAGFTPYWACDDCASIEPGNVGVSSVDAVGDFNCCVNGVASFRPPVIGNYKHRVGNQIWDPNAFGDPILGADLFSNPAVATRNLLIGPGAWGVNLGVHKEFHFGERFTASLGVDIDNLFNHPMFAPDADYGGGGGEFAMLGDFNVAVDPATLKPIIATNPDTGLPDITRNDLFGQLVRSFDQEGVNSRRTIRLRARITF